MTSPLGQMTGAPAAQSTMSQPWVPASAAGQWTTQRAPAAQVVWHGDARQVNVQALPESQTHCPLAHVPVQLLFGSQVTWQGGALQVKSHALPLPQVQVPFAHTAWHSLLFPSHVAWQGGAVQTKRQSSPAGQAQVPLWQPPTMRAPHAAAVAASPNARAHLKNSRTPALRGGAASASKEISPGRTVIIYDRGRAWDSSEKGPAPFQARRRPQLAGVVITLERRDTGG
jgi:hypothetical protein